MKARAIFFELNDKSFHYDFGTYALILFYTNQMNGALTKKIFDAMMSEFFYRTEYDIPIDDLTAEDEEIHFDISNIQDVVQFIDQLLIPALEQEPLDLIQKYGGRNSFYKLFKASNIPIGINENEWYVSLPSDLIFRLGQFTELARYALSINQPYAVYVV